MTDEKLKNDKENTAPENKKSGKNEKKRFIDKAVVFLEKLAAQRHVLALRDGMLASIPIILVGSTFLLLGAQSDIINQYFSGSVSWLPNIADTVFGRWYLAHSVEFYMPYRMTMGLLGLYIAFTVACALAVQYKMAPVPQGLGAAAALFVTELPYKHSILDEMGVQSSSRWVLPIDYIGPKGMFLGIIMAFCMVELSRLFAPKNSAESDKETDKLKNAIPPAVGDAFRSFLPMLILIGLVWSADRCLVDLNDAVMKIMSPLSSMGDSLGAVLVCNFFLHLFAVAGVHGISVINAVMLPLWQQFVSANAEAHSAGLILPHITAYPFYQWFIWLGGSGATLAPTVMLLFFKKNEHFKKVGRIAIVPALFNVNEPFLFGLPVIANPILALPCILAPMVCGLISWFAVSWGFVSAPFLEVPWIMPCFLGALLSTQDPMSLVLVILNLTVSALIWYPFLKYSDKRGLLNGSSAEEKAG